MICRPCALAGDMLGPNEPIQPAGLAEAQRNYRQLHDRCTGCTCQHRDAVLVATLPDEVTPESMARFRAMVTAGRVSR